MSSEAIASLMANIPADHAAGLASLMARGNDPSQLESLFQQENSSMSSIIDSYINNLKQIGFVPNANTTANTTASKRDVHSLDSLIEKRSVPSMPLIIDLLAQHGFVPTDGSNSTTSKRDVSDAESALAKHNLPDINLVISRLEVHGFVPSGNTSQSNVSKRDTASDINTIIGQLQAYGFNPQDYMQGNYSALGNDSAQENYSTPGNSSELADVVAPPSVNVSASVLSAVTGVTCPQDNGMTFSTSSDTYQVLCDAVFNGYDVHDVHADNLPECLQACSEYVPQGSFQSYGPCVGASWYVDDGGNNCFLKYNATTSVVNNYIFSGKKIS